MAGRDKLSVRRFWDECDRWQDLEDDWGLKALPEPLACFGLGLG